MHWIYWMKKQLSTNQHKSKIYRKGVGIMLLNKEGKIFVGQRFDKDKSAWQMPQGGVDKGEKSIEALKRELEEETGIKNNYKIIVIFVKIHASIKSNFSQSNYYF